MLHHPQEDAACVSDKVPPGPIQNVRLYPYGSVGSRDFGWNLPTLPETILAYTRDLKPDASAFRNENIHMPAC